MHHRTRPRWLPNSTWNLFVASDHHPSDMRPNSNSPSLAVSASRYDIRQEARRKLEEQRKRLQRRKRRHRDLQNDFNKEVGRLVHMSGPIDNQDRLAQPVSVRVGRQLMSVDADVGTSERRNVAEEMLLQKQTRESGEFMHTYNASEAEVRRNAFLTPLVPGVTIPAGDIWYMIIAVLTAAMVHELGHALAAGMQNGHVSVVGAFLALAVPGAYVQLTGVEKMATVAQLRVYCAGVWHNVMTAIFALVTVLLLPNIMGVGYVRGVGAIVVDVPMVSPLFAYVEPGDVIIGMGRFAVSDGGPSFRNAVGKLISTRDSVGFCVGGVLFDEFNKGERRCCEKAVMEDGGGSQLQCFREQGGKGGRCLDPARVSVRRTCRMSVDCEEGGGGGGKCLVAVLARNQQLVDIRVISGRSGEVVHFFYEGYPHILGQSVTVSSYVPRGWRVMPGWFLRLIAALDVPNVVERLLQYFSSISLGLAVVNMAPVFYFDGEASTGLFLRLLGKLVGGWTEGRVRRVHRGMVGVGSVLILLNIAMTIADIGR